MAEMDPPSPTPPAWPPRRAWRQNPAALKSLLPIKRQIARPLSAADIHYDKAPAGPRRSRIVAVSVEPARDMTAPFHTFKTTFCMYLMCQILHRPSSHLFLQRVMCAVDRETILLYTYILLINDRLCFSFFLVYLILKFYETFLVFLNHHIT